jgi:AcrR family transcriptional regulator
MPKIVDHHRYRQELLSQCLSLFADRSFRALTMRQIAAGLGVSTGTLYHYFPNKDSIFVQLVNEYCEKGIAEFFAQARIEDALPDKLNQVMTFVIHHYAHYQQQLLIWVDFYQYSQQSGQADVTVLQEFWARAQAQLGRYLQLPTEHIDCLLTFIDGLLLQCLYGRDSAAIAQQTEAFVEMYCRAFDSSSSSPPSDACKHAL